MFTNLKRFIFAQAIVFALICGIGQNQAIADQVLSTDRLMLFNEWSDGKDYGYPLTDEWQHYGTLFYSVGGTKKLRLALLSGSNHVHNAGWCATNVAVGSSSYLNYAQYIKPQRYTFLHSPTNFAANFFNKVGSVLVSPYYKEGVGTIYFDAVNSLKTITGTLGLEIATNMVGRNNINVVKDIQEQEDATWIYKWEPLKDISLTETTGGAVTGVAVQETLNYHKPIKFRIVRRDAIAQTQVYYDQNFLIVDNIQVSYPQREVEINSVNVNKTRGKSLSVTFTCVVSNKGEVEENASVYTFSDNSNRKVVLHYSNDGGTTWGQKEMSYNFGSGDKGNGEEYVSDLDLTVGQQSLLYYCTVEVTGNRYFPQDFTESSRVFWPGDGGEPGQSAQSAQAEKNVSAWSVPSVVTTMGQDRILLFNTWTNGVDYGDYYGDTVESHVGKNPTFGNLKTERGKGRAHLLNGSNHFYNTGWQVLNASVGSSAFLRDPYGTTSRSNYIAPSNYVEAGISSGSIVTNWHASLWNTLDAMIISPSYLNGIGTIYFDAVNVYTEGELAIDICTNMVSNIGGAVHYAPFATEEYNDGFSDWKFNWQTIGKQTLAREYAAVLGSDNFYRIKIPVNYYGGIKTRIRRATIAEQYEKTALDDAFIAIDNIQISEPSADVVVAVDEVPFNPAYPSLNDDIRVRCRVSNVNGAPATTSDDRGVVAVWRWKYGEQTVNPWSRTRMEYVGNTDGDDGNGNGELYEGKLPKQENIGDIEYYFECNFDGARYKPFDYALFNYKFWDGDNSENHSPRQCRKGDPEKGIRDFYARLRRYKSNLGAMFLNTDLQYDPIEMELIGDDVWRGMVPVYKWAKTTEDFTVYFSGTNTYRVGIDANGKKTYSIDDKARFWNEADSYAAIPTGGICAESAVEPYDGIMKFTIPQSGYVSLTLDLNDNSYKARRSEYQDFNEWQAWDAFFASTFYNRDAQAYKDDIDGNGEEGSTGWDESMPDTQDEYFRVASSNLWVDSVFKDYIVTDRKTFELANASYVGELEQVNATNSAFGASSENNKFFPNVSARLIGIEHLAENTNNLVALGSIYTLAETVIDGLQQFDFKARAAEIRNIDGIASYDLSAHESADLDETNYTATVKLEIKDASPEEFSVSVIGFRKRKSFYELRLTQCAPRKVTSPRQGGVIKPVVPYYSLDLYRWNNGKPTLLKSDTTADKEHVQLDITANDIVLKLTVVKNAEKGQTELKGEYFVGTSTSAKRSVTFNDLDGDRLLQGDCGFWSANCQASVKAASLTDYSQVLTEYPLLLNSENWDYDEEFFFAKNDYEFTTRKPTNKIAIYIQDADVEHKADPADRKWTLYKELPVSTYKYMPYTLSFDSWKAKHIKIQNLGIADVAIDEINMIGYHARTVGGNIYDWDGQEIWVEKLDNEHNKVITLDLSRADNSAYGSVAAGERQSVRAPFMDWGRASFAFEYQVTTYPVLLALQISDDEYGPWETVSYHPQTNALNTGWNKFYEYLGNTNSGCMRIVNVMTNGFIDADGKSWDFTNGVVRLDNFIAWDNPVPTNSVAWKTYNGRITDSNPAILTLDGSKVLVLNNSTMSDVYDGYAPMNLSKPYLKTPAISTGIGEIRLEARLFEPQSEPATLKVYGLVGDEWTVDGVNWERIAQLDVTNIASQYYTVFTHDGQRVPGVDPEHYKAIKFESEYDGSQPRICIENVSITEPLYPGFEINSVKLLHHTNAGEYDYREQPLVTDLVGVEAKLTNLRLNPQDIKVYLSYYVGTNLWGATKIWGEKNQWKPTQPNTIELIPYGDPANHIYRTPFDNDIPFQDENAVVQYVVWATYTSEEGGVRYTTVQSETSFRNPDWYYPTDLNALYGSWSPYYIVYRVPRGAVFFNELNFQERPSLTTGTDFGVYYNSFIEMAIPADTDMTGWRVELIDADLNQQMAVRLITPEGGKSEVTNGYAFLVIADSQSEQEFYTGSQLPNVDIFKPGLNESFVYARDPGGLRLKRPLGMYEQAITFDRYGDADNSIIDAGTGEPFSYVGNDTQYASLSVTNGTGESFNDWATIAWRDNAYLPDHSVVLGDNVKVWTPGEPNLFQVMPEAPEIFAGISNVVVMAYLVPQTKGLQNGSSGRLAFKMSREDSTNIVYDTHNWYHVTSVLITDEKTGAVRECVGTDIFRMNNSTNYTLTLANLTNSVTIRAMINPDDRYQDPNLPYTVREWLMDYPEAEVSAHTSWLVPWNMEAPGRTLFSIYPQDQVRQLSFTEMYWLNCEPIRNNVVRHGLAGVEAPSSDPDKPENMNLFVNFKMRLEYEADDGTGAVITNKISSLRGSTVDVDIPAFKIKVANPTQGESEIKWQKVAQYTFGDATFDDDYNCRVKLNIDYPFLDGETTLRDSNSWWFRYIIEFEDGAFSRPILQNTPVSNP